MSARKMLSVVIAPPAAFEIMDAAGAYEATRAGLGRVFLEELGGVRDRIQEHPESCPQVHPTGLRRALVHRFPFGVIYRVTAREIQVLAVLPTRADPHRIEAKTGGAVGMA
jgi:hypothetical protein